MSSARFLIGDVRKVLRSLSDQSVHSVITSPPYWRKRAYLPADHPDKASEIGQEPSPGEFLATLLGITDELWRIVRDDGTIWFNLGDTASGSGGAGGDYNPGGLRDGQPRFPGSAVSAETPLAKSICWIPELFGASLAYGRNLLTGAPCRQWITRPSVTWCKPNPPVGEIIDKFREATELIVLAAKSPRYYFDLDPLRTPTDEPVRRKVGRASASKGIAGGDSGNPDKIRRSHNPKGSPPLNWWEIPGGSFEGAHFATFPPELIYRPVIASCPEGGTILDPFGGSGTTGMVATGNNRNAILIDLDGRNLDLARERIGFFLEVDEVGAA